MLDLRLEWSGSQRRCARNVRDLEVPGIVDLNRESTHHGNVMTVIDIVVQCQVTSDTNTVSGELGISVREATHDEKPGIFLL